MQYLESDPVRLDEDRENIIVIDQRALPEKLEFLKLNKAEEMYDAIKTLAVRGAPCIGVFAGYCIAILAKSVSGSFKEFRNKMAEYAGYLESARPTAVNLSWALNRQMKLIASMEKDKTDSIREALMEEAVRIHEEDIGLCLSISEYGLSLLHDGDGILTHCNAGALATTRYGTGLGPILLGTKRGMRFHVYSDETRPLLQGIRLSSYELAMAGVDETVICDNMAGLVMKQGRIDAVLVGCDRIAANGDVANKIGTCTVAILAKYYGIPFYVLGPYSTIDTDCASGDDIKIEERGSEEISSLWYERDFSVKGVKYYNPAFDVTDHSLITAIITDKGILRPPFEKAIKEIRGAKK